MAFDLTNLRNSRLDIAAATEGSNAVRLDQLTGGQIGVLYVSVVDIDDPAAELLTLNNSMGNLLQAQQVVQGAVADKMSFYIWDTSGAAVSSPYIVQGSGGRWIAAGPRYSNFAMNLRDTLNVGGIVTFAGNPRCMAYRATTQAIPDSTATIARFLTERYDVGGYYNNSDVDGTGGKFTIGAGGAGTYHVSAHTNWVYNATGQRNMGIFVNSTEWWHDQILPSSNGAGQQISGDVDCIAGDVITVQVLQNSGGSLNIDPTTNTNSNIVVAIRKVA